MLTAHWRVYGRVVTFRCDGRFLVRMRREGWNVAKLAPGAYSIEGMS